VCTLDATAISGGLGRVRGRRVRMRELAYRRPWVVGVAREGAVADRDLGRFGGEGPVLAGADAQGDAAVAAGAVEPQHLGVAALDRLEPLELGGLAVGELQRGADERDLARVLGEQQLLLAPLGG
jgi:hypothetical protein